MVAKELLFDAHARARLQKGVDTPAEAGKVTPGPTGRNVVIDGKFGPPAITRDGTAATGIGRSLVVMAILCGVFAGIVLLLALLGRPWIS